jgi:phospholipid-translocating ATPase
VLILLAVFVFELSVKSGKAAWWTTDEHVFQALEKDPLVKRRFEEAAAGELQAGWDRKGSKEGSAGELEGGRHAETEQVQQREMEREREERRREGEITDLIRNRVDGAGDAGLQDHGSGGGGGGDVNRILSRGFGDVKTS